MPDLILSETGQNKKGRAHRAALLWTRNLISLMAYGYCTDKGTACLCGTYHIDTIGKC